MDFVHVLFGVFGIIGGFGLGWMVFSAKLAKNSAYISGFKERLSETGEALETTRRERTELHERAVTAEAKNKSLEQRLQEQQEQLRTEFQNTANKIFDEMSKKFSFHSEKKIGDLLNPVQQHLTDFKKLVVDSFTSQGKEQHTLKSEIEKIAKMNDSLTKALRGDVKAQGNWGEVMLERILEASGLRRDIDYIIQGTDMSLTGAEGNRLKPDVIVKLPDGKHIIIDSKVSLTAYDRYCNQPEETHLKDFLKSVRAHVNILESKRYQDIEKLGSPDMVFMFMPIEGAFSFAMQHDQELHSFAWSKGIIIVPPSNLFANLRTVASIWRIEQQNRNSLQIAEEGGKMYDKLVGFVQDMLDIGKQINRSQQIYDQALTKLQTGSGNLIGRAEKMKQLGAKASKNLPVEMRGEEEDEAPELRQVAGIKN